MDDDNIVVTDNNADENTSGNINENTGGNTNENTDENANENTGENTDENANENIETETAEEETGVTREVLQEAAGEALVSILKGGQSYKIGSRQLTKVDFSALRSFKKDLDAAEAAENNKSGLFDNCYVADFLSR